jgi:hypothetical protein
MGTKRADVRVVGVLNRLARPGLVKLFWGKSSPEVALMYSHVIDSLRGRSGELCVDISGEGCSEDFISEISEMICEDLIHSIDLDEYEALAADEDGVVGNAGVSTVGWPERDELCAVWLEMGLVPVGIVNVPTPVRGVMLYALVDEDGEVLEWLVNDES